MHLFNVQTKLRAARQKTWYPPEGKLVSDINKVPASRGEEGGVSLRVHRQMCGVCCACGAASMKLMCSVGSHVR